MENTLSVTLMIAFLLIGAVGGAVLAPEKTEIEYVDRVEYVNSTVEKVVEISAPNQLDLALIAFKNAVEDYEVLSDITDEDSQIDYLDRYEFDEFEVYRIYDAYTVAYDDEKTTVEFEVKVRFDEEHEAAEKFRHNVLVVFEEGEDTLVQAELFNFD